MLLSIYYKDTRKVGNKMNEHENNLYFFEDKKENENNITQTNNLKKYKKEIDKYCFTISLGCMLKIGLLLVGNFILFLLKLYIYITYC